MSLAPLDETEFAEFVVMTGTLPNAEVRQSEKRA
jgi:hypothetical protein